MNLKKNILSFHFLLLLTFVNAQITAYYKNEEVTKIYSIVDEKENTNFFFPVYNNFPYKNKGYSVRENTSIEIPEKFINNFKDGLSISIRYYTKNVANIHFYIVNNENKRQEISNNFNPVDGYNVSGIIGLDLNKNQFLKQIVIEFDIKNKNMPFDFIFASLDLVKYVLKNEVSPSNIFQNYPFDNGKFRNDFKYTTFQSKLLLSKFPKSITKEKFKGSIEIINKGNKSINEMLIECVLLFLKDYPFYREKKINEDEFLKSSKLTFEKYEDLSKCDLIDSLNVYLNRTINDPHFKIRSNCEKSEKYTPIYVYEIKGKYIISAIFDEELKQKIPLGSEILKINNQSFLDEKLNYKDINEKLLKNIKGSSVSLEIKTPSEEIKKISYFIKDKYHIPDNFKPQNLLIKKIDDSIVYFKINKITSDLNISYLNNYNLINNSKGLVLDFRGCSGGDFVAASQFLSYILDKKFLFFKYGDGYDNKKYPIIVNKPKDNTYIFNKNKKIALLTDEGTACVAEMMINALSKYRNIKPIIVSKDQHTAGALSFAYEVNLPEGVNILTNCLGDKRKIFLDNKIIENSGIKSHIITSIESVEDLQPYNDKVLKNGINYLLTN